MTSLLALYADLFRAVCTETLFCVGKCDDGSLASQIAGQYYQSTNFASIVDWTCEHISDTLVVPT